MMEEDGIMVALPHNLDTLSHYFFALDGVLVASFGLRDSLKEGAHASISLH